MTSVLIVDDHPAIGFALKVLLEKTAAFTVSLSGGENLLAQLHQRPPQLMILDLELRHADGLDLLPRIRQHFPDMRVLIFTSQPAGIYALRTFQAGASGFISKSLPLEHIAPLCQLIAAGYQCFPEGTLTRAAAVAESREAPDALLARLSDREMAVLHFLRQGRSNKEIADSLALSNKTISTYKARMLQKCGCDDLSQLIALLRTEP